MNGLPLWGGVVSPVPHPADPQLRIVTWADADDPERLTIPVAMDSGTAPDGALTEGTEGGTVVP